MPSHQPKKKKKKVVKQRGVIHQRLMSMPTQMPIKWHLVFLLIWQKKAVFRRLSLNYCKPFKTVVNNLISVKRILLPVKAWLKPPMQSLCSASKPLKVSKLIFKNCLVKSMKWSKNVLPTLLPFMKK